MAPLDPGELAHLDQQLSAARDANARLTAEVVRLEIVEKQLTQQVRHLDDLVSQYQDAYTSLWSAHQRQAERLHDVEETLSRARIAAMERIEQLEQQLTARGW